ncbi:flavin-containing monooxygenase [Actinokineospora iranica]|uniref:Predicted flavoprotein CzcO associated with the cation diffusion facilitator CzcD n=1 Tax=Actinokineospora iranica TaxID=1271860 RepID=A0A1G6LCL0_9PSEU|nr:NAD(P)/FAD-dependent oxidoreductase [Actinokineospora iranica]SDC40948.1 Predicted flavoprotein CzcO associated with the cation diffusion facilitator CzcD [Actinokineospora iranica]
MAGEHVAGDYVDVLIVGAGLSGVGAACHLRRKCPGKSLAILEARGAVGGTWDLFRYPGIRSDSDMFTLGYSFRPWTRAKAIADGASIREYIGEAATEHGVAEKIRFRHKVVAAEWSSDRAMWTVTVERGAETVTMTCGFLYLCTGYYRYDQGHTPEFPGADRFAGPIVHPQHWPEDLDWTGKRVVVIGSGATAVTLVPAMTGNAEHVTMLQRSPSYVLTLGSRDPIADWARDRLPAKVAYPLVRWKNVLLATLLFQLSRRKPDLVRGLLRRDAVRRLPAGYDVDTHFRPAYDPWDQRLCFVPDGDLFRAVRTGQASVVTDTIKTFTETGIALDSGDHLPADVIVTATGLELLMVGGITLTVDGDEIDPADTVAYKGMMFSGVPNLVMTMGYTNASWTLKADLVAHYVCRLLDHMAEHGLDQCTPQAPDPTLPREPFLDLTSGYIQRASHRLPKQGPTTPWRLHQNYPRDIALLRHGPLDDGVLFSRAGSAQAGSAR